MRQKYGFNSIINIPTHSNPQQNTNQKYPAVRVKSVVLDETHPRFEEVGGWSGVGAIEYDSILNPTAKNTNFPISYPLNPNIKNYPINDELVYLTQLPSNDIGNTSSQTNMYYVSIVGIWNHPHHNRYPTDNTKISFPEKTNINPLKAFEGDTIIEGRFGNSIRFGNTVKGKNTWSSEGENGDPILIIRNGQNPSKIDPWIPIQEDINNDKSLILLTTNQKIPINDNYKNYDSYNTPPTQQSKYTSNQIIISSGRILFNSNKDHILLNSIKSISLNSNEGVYIDSKGDFITNTKNIYLGSRKATEPLLLGNKTEQLLKSLINTLSAFSIVCSSLVSTPSGTPLAPLNQVAMEMKNIMDELKKDLPNIKSNKNYTI